MNYSTPTSLTSHLSPQESFELEKMRLEQQEKRELRRSEMFKWFVALVWPSILSLMTTVITGTTAATAAKEAKEAREEVKAVREVSTSTNAITARWWADKTGDPQAAAKAAESESMLESMNPSYAAPAAPASPPE